MIATTLPWNSTMSLTPGGTIETETRIITGPEVFRMSIAVSVALIKIVLILPPNAIVTRFHQHN